MVEPSIEVSDSAGGFYEVRVDGEHAGQLMYRTPRPTRRILTHTVIDEKFRGRGLSKVLVRDVLDDLRRQGATITIFCPVVHAFIQQHPEYESLVDADHPGSWPKSAAQSEAAPGS